MDIVKVINQYIADDESSLGNAVEDSIIDLETLFKLQDEALFNNLRIMQRNPLGFYLGVIGGVKQSKLKSALSAVAKDIQRSYKECVCEVKCKPVGCTLKISTTAGYALLSIKQAVGIFNDNEYDITILIVQ